MGNNLNSKKLSPLQCDNCSETLLVYTLSFLKEYECNNMNKRHKTKTGSEGGEDPKTQTKQTLYAHVGGEAVVLFLIRLLD